MAEKKSNKSEAKKTSKSRTVAVKSKSKRETVKVKTASEVKTDLSQLIEATFHSNIKTRLSEKTKEKIVSYGPWLMGALHLVILPELIILAKTSQLVGLAGFLQLVLFNQQSWVILAIMFGFSLMLANGLQDVFEKRLSGWDRMYQATFITLGYAIFQLITNLIHPAAPLLSIGFCISILFVLYEIKPYYK